MFLPVQGSSCPSFPRGIFACAELHHSLSSARILPASLLGSAWAWAAPPFRPPPLPPSRSVGSGTFPSPGHCWHFGSGRRCRRAQRCEPRSRVAFPGATGPGKCLKDGKGLEKRLFVIYFPFFFVLITPIGVSFRSVAVLKSICPGALVFGTGHRGLPDSVSPLEALSPFSSVQPASPSLYAEPMPLSVLPMAFVGAAAESKQRKGRWF